MLIPEVERKLSKPKHRATVCKISMSSDSAMSDRPMCRHLEMLRTPAIVKACAAFGQFLGLFARSIIGIALILFFIGSAPSADHLSESANLAYQTVQYVGAFWVIGHVIWRTLFVPFVHELNTGEFIIGVIERTILLILSLVVVRIQGNTLTSAIAWIKTNPDSALALSAGVIFIRFMFSFTSPESPNYSRGSISAFAVGLKGDKYIRTEKDIHRTAVHEAGHLMLYADLPELPSDLKVTVLSVIGSGDKFRGQVTHTRTSPEVCTESFLWWSMLLNLAGSEAEFLILGERADGANGDISEWMRLATSYLTSGFGEAFYFPPSNDSERNHNRDVLNDLKAIQRDELQRRFSANNTVLDELSSVIANKKTMTRDELQPYLVRVVKAK